jgi:hypothetical protein
VFFQSLQFLAKAGFLVDSVEIALILAKKNAVDLCLGSVESPGLLEHHSIHGSRTQPPAKFGSSVYENNVVKDVMKQSNLLSFE